MLILVIFLRLHLSIQGFGALIDLLKNRKKSFLKINYVSYVSKSVEIVASLIPNITCLVKASVLKIIFTENEDLKVMIGITNNNAGLFESHAWVTLNSEVILNNDMKIDSYEIICSI